MILVLDSSALITLARIGRLDLLHHVAGIVHIPDAVYDEVVTFGQVRPGSAEVARSQWISRHQVQDQGAVDRLRARVGKGEAEAIVLARELQADVLILDDATARRIAEGEKRKVAGLLGQWKQRSHSGEFSSEHQYSWRVSPPLLLTPSMDRPASGAPA